MPRVVKTGIDLNGRAFTFINRLFTTEQRLRGSALTFHDVIRVWTDAAWQSELNARARLARLIRLKRSEAREE